MLKWLKQLDEILRGDATRLSSLEEGKIEIPVAGLSIVVVLLGAIYGLCMGSFPVLTPKHVDSGAMQMFASAVKLPLLFFLTLLVTFPSLYVFNALVGSRLSIESVWRLLVAAIGVMLAVLASLGPIVVFFSVSTTSYPFMKLLNVVMGTASGVLGLAFLLRTLNRLVLMQEWKDRGADAKPAKGSKAAKKKDAAEDEPLGALDRLEHDDSRRARIVFQIWVFVFALVGAQMSWVLRPFVGSPTLQFEWFRERKSNFFMAVLDALKDLFS